MTVEDNHVLNIDGQSPNKYRISGPDDDAEGQNLARSSSRMSRASRMSGVSASNSQNDSKQAWYKGITFKDIRDITPTLLILLGGILIMIFVIPYAFSSVIKQLQNDSRRHASNNEVLNSTNGTDNNSTSQFNTYT